MRTVDIRRDRVELRTLIVPGLSGSGPQHWQSLWQEEHPDFERVVQSDWASPDLDRWARTVADSIDEHSGKVVLVGHSFGALACVRTHALRPGRVAGALLVAPADPVKFSLSNRLASLRPGATWVLVASRDDPWFTFGSARAWATRWSTDFVDAGHLGHVNADSGIGVWPQGARLLAQLQRQLRPTLHAAIAAPLAA